MAAGFITNAISGYVNPIVNSAVSTAGGFAGDMVGGVGSGLNGAGAAIESTIRRYGDATSNYGNAIKDWSGADVGRKGTAQNPLGLSDTSGAGKRALTAPMQTQPKKKSDVKFPALPQPGPAPTQKALPPPKINIPGKGNTKAPVRSKSAPSRPPGLAASKYAPPSNGNQSRAGAIQPRGKPMSKYAPPNASQNSSGAKRGGRSLESMPDSMRQKHSSGAEKRKANNYASRAGASAGAGRVPTKTDIGKASKDPLGIAGLGLK